MLHLVKVAEVDTKKKGCFNETPFNVDY